MLITVQNKDQILNSIRTSMCVQYRRVSVNNVWIHSLIFKLEHIYLKPTGKILAGLQSDMTESNLLLMRFFSPALTRFVLKH